MNTFWQREGCLEEVIKEVKKDLEYQDSLDDDERILEHVFQLYREKVLSPVDNGMQKSSLINHLFL